jgi:4-amino-4-deoxy-L-arabinose transferase-like glycosyltransferase
LPAPDARRDLLLLALAALIPRLIAFGSLGVDHFDEGGYAMTAAAIASGDAPRGFYPLLHYLSPPVYFGTGAVLMALLGTSSATVLFGLSAAAGTATVLAVYLVGRRWLGRAAAGAAALAIALSDYHILYSRAGLTDALFLALLILALGAFARAEDRQSRSGAVLAGVLTGLAWNTKYHGWLAGAIAAAALIPAFVAATARGRRDLILRLVIAAAVAVVLYVPWVLYVDGRPGGYSRLTAEHARFLKPASLVQNALAQLRAQWYLEGWTARLAPLALAAWLALTDVRARRVDTVVWAITLTVMTVLVGATAMLGILGAWGVVLLLKRHGLRWTPHWFALAFFGTFTVLTPLYTPYPRLLLPWLAAAALLAGVTIERLLTVGPSGRFRLAAPIAVAVVGGIVMGLRGLRPAAVPWAPRDQLRAGAEEVRRLASVSEPIVVLGEPGVVYYLRQSGREAWHIDRPEEASRYVPAGSPFYLVGGIYSRRVRGSRSLEAWLTQRPEGVLAGTARVAGMSDVRLLEDFSALNARRFRRETRGDYDLRVYHIGRSAP